MNELYELFDTLFKYLCVYEISLLYVVMLGCSILMTSVILLWGIMKIIMWWLYDYYVNDDVLD